MFRKRPDAENGKNDSSEVVPAEVLEKLPVIPDGFQRRGRDQNEPKFKEVAPAPREAKDPQQAKGDMQRPQHQPPQQNQKQDAPANAALAKDVARLLGDARKDLERAFQAEMGRVEQALKGVLDDAATRLVEAQSRIERLEQEAATLRDQNAEFSRKISVVREMQQKLEKI